MFGIENKLYEQLCLLKREFNLQGIKAEFEAEGSSFRDLMRLRRVTAKADVDLYLKIGGVEALRDIKDSLELGVDGLIAPMCETRFGVRKFIDSYKTIYRDHKIHLSINVETRNAIEEIDEIINEAEGFIDNITIGRSDLSASYFDKDIKPDSDFILGVIKSVSEKLINRNLSMTVGGSLTISSVDKISQDIKLRSVIKKLETRKVMLPTDIMLDNPDAVKQCLRFEELYILSKKEFSDLFIDSEINRLTNLKRRI